MSSIISITIIAAALLAMMSLPAEARMLPTRSNEDQLDKLRELLRDILETDDSHPKISNSLVEKRSGYDRDLDFLYKDYPPHALNDLRYLSYYKKGLPLRLYGLMKNGDD
ncbi:uncharacterized protein LOC134835591 [Culicoides brevitarsis]|uniref:uncharacterized protein LOC134835591 n=1 Tax=Culicoides brevitarsis TaxID=469753 RepID=UPI00307C314A